jgi:tripartite-type tricarboxylate transporter receptor subunit TctC
MRTIVKFFGLAFAICVASAPISEAFASKKKAGSLYRGRTITILVGYGSGGTYGRTSLLLAEYIGKYIPRKPNVVVQHMPGAGGLKATNYAANVMPANGLNLLMPPEMTIASAILRPKKVKFKPQEFKWLGRVFGQNNAVVIRRDSGVTDWKGLLKKQVIVASSGKGSPTFLVPAMLNGLLGTKLKIVTGYSGSRKMQLSVEQGETQGSALGWLAWSSGRPDWFKNGMGPGGKSTAIPVLQIGYSPMKGIEKVPMIQDQLKSADDKKIANVLASASIIGRALVLPAGAPDWLTTVLRGSFAKVVKDKKFVAGAYKRRLDVNPLSGAEIQGVVQDLMNVSPALAKRARKLIFGN